MVNLETPSPISTPAKNSLSLIYRDSQQTLPQRLFQPLNIAIVVSAVLHGVIGYGAPALPFFQHPATPREVKIMQLTPQEQSRIRRDVQPLPPAVTGVPIPNAPSQGRTFNPGLTGTFPNNSNNFSTVPRGSSFPTYVPDDGTTFVPANPRQFRTFGGGATQYTIPTEPGGNRQTVIVPRESPAPNVPVRRSDQFRTADNFTTAGRSILNSPFTRPTPTPSATSTPVATPAPTPSPTSGNPENNNGSGTSNPTSIPTPTPSIAANGGNSEGNNNGNAGNPNNTNTGTPGGATPNPLLAFNPEGTELTPDSQDSGFVGFLGAGNEQFLQADKQVRLTLDVTYPLEACVLKLDKPVTAIFGVMINEAGAIAKGPDLIQSSGYGIFNEAAKAATIAYTQFTPAKVYIVSVPFVYSQEACAGASTLPATTQGTAP